MATPVMVKSKIRGQQSNIKIEDGKIIDVSLVSDVKKGDWLLVHGDLAINKISKKEADNIFQLIGQCSHGHEHKNSHSHSH
jgi:hydrogenase maturation factor